MTSSTTSIRRSRRWTEKRKYSPHIKMEQSQAILWLLHFSWAIQKCIVIRRTTLYNKVEEVVYMKDATVSARVECDVKNEAERILQQLGIPVSVVINSLYRQIIYKRGIPFPVTLPDEPRSLDAMTEDELHAMLEHSYAQSLAGKGRLAKDVFDELERGIH